MRQKYAFVMMIHDKWWQQFLSKNQQDMQVHSYVKTGYGSPKETSKILFYVTKPVGRMAGHAEFVERKVGGPEEIWAQHGHESAIGSRQGFGEFVKDTQLVSFIRFKNLRQASNPVTLKNLLQYLGAKRLSRAGFYMDKEEAEKLISLME